MFNCNTRKSRLSYVSSCIKVPLVVLSQGLLKGSNKEKTTKITLKRYSVLMLTIVTVQLSPTLEKESTGTPAVSNNVVDDNSQQHLQLDTEEIHEDLHYTIIEDKSRNSTASLGPLALLTALCLCLSIVINNQ